ncbi:UNVERIFIED_CONTAM: hypothetical protein HDU68_002635 [Siphonaria sp. JEL0065]|nr:hypothetical protein HDU68_002635 [Siphonaria sp. JEL0065]
MFCSCCGSDDVDHASVSEPSVAAGKVVSSTIELDVPVTMSTTAIVSNEVKKKESNVSIAAESVLEEPVPEDQQVPHKDDISPIPSSDDGSVEHLLPRILPKHAGKKCLVLDLDETLVHSSFKPVANADLIIPIDIEGTYHNVYVLKRPHVDSFLENLGKEFEIVVFTASMSNYANPVLDLLDTHKVIEHRLFREHCVFYNGAYVKDLTMLGRPIEDCIIVDNSAFSYAFQPENAVPCQSWYNDLEDDELLELQPFLMGLKTIPDVRTVLGAAGDSADDAYENIV